MLSCNLRSLVNAGLCCVFMVIADASTFISLPREIHEGKVD